MIEPWRKPIIIFDPKRDKAKKEEKKLEEIKHLGLDPIVDWKDKDRRIATVSFVCENCYQFLRKTKDGCLECPDCGIKFEF